MNEDGRAPVAIWLLGLLLALGLIVQTRLATDMSAFLPRGATARQQALVDQLRDGVASRIVLLALDNAAPDTLARLSKALAEQLRSNSAIAFVNNGDLTALSADRDYLWRNRFLLSSDVTAARFTAGGLREALQSSLGQLGTPMGMLIKKTLPADPTGAFFSVLEPLNGGASPTLYDGVWFSPELKRAVLMVQAKAEAYDIDVQERVLGDVQAAFAALRAQIKEAGQARLTATGPPLFAIQSRAQIKSDATRLSMFATGLVAILLLLAYRSLPILMLALLPVATGALAGIGAVALGFGFVHGITLAFGVTLIGEAVDYAIYLLSRSGPESAPAVTLHKIWPVLRLGLLTSVFGFSAMLFSGFPGFVQLGLFTICGLATAAIVTRYVLPHLVKADFAGARSMVFAQILLPVRSHERLFRLLACGLTVAALGALFLHRGSFWESELASMNPIPMEALKLDQSLRKDMGAPDVRYLVMAEASTQEGALNVSAMLDRTLSPLIKQGALDGIDGAHLYLPSQAAQKARQAALPDAKLLASNLDAALVGLPFKPGVFAPFLADVAAAKTQPLLARDSLKDTALKLKLDALLIKRGQTWLALLPLYHVRAPTLIQQALRPGSWPNAALLDLKQESSNLLANYLREAQTLALAGSAAIAALLGLALRSWRRVAAVLAPLGIAVLITAAILTLNGKALSIFNLFGLLLVVAVGSNYCLFFERGADHGDADRLLGSLVLANLCTVIGFGVLSFSKIPVLHGIGTTVALGTILSLLLGAIMSAPPQRTAP